MGNPAEKKDDSLVRSYGTRLTITPHAMSRVRMRSSEHQHRFCKMPDRELRAELEDIWRRTGGEVWWEMIAGEAVPNTIFPLGFDDLVALVREDRERPGHAVMVTVLPQYMIERNKNQRKWVRFKESLGVDHSLPNTQLADQLKGLSLLEVSVARATPKPFAAVDPTPAPPKILPTPPEGQILVRWIDSEDDGCERLVEQDAVDDLVSRLIEQGVKEETIEFWQQCWQRRQAKIKRTVVVTF